MTFALLDGDSVLVSGEVQADFDTPTLIVDGVVDAVTTVTIAEIQLGLYEASFTKPSGECYLFVQHTASSSAWDSSFSDPATSVPTAAAIAAAVGALTKDGYTLLQHLGIQSAVLAGKASGGPSGTAFRDVADARDAVTTSANGNGDRASVTIDP